MSCQKLFDPFRCRGKAGQVQRDAADQLLGGGFGGWFQPRGGEPSVNEMVDRIDAPVGCGGLGSNRRDKGPMIGIRGTRLDPRRQQSDLVGGQLLVRLRRWHHHVGIGFRNAKQKLGIGQVARVDRG